MFALISRFVEEESGQALVEYGAVVGLMVAAAIAIIAIFRTQIQTLFTNIAAQFNEIPG